VNFKPGRAATLAAELVHLQVDAIVCTGGRVPAAAAKGATATIPIVFTASDPVRAGLVLSLDRPGGNLTGINLLAGELNVKRLDLLTAAVPGVARVAVFANPANPGTARGLQDLDGAARGLRVKLQVLHVRERQGIDDAFAAIARERAQALLVMNDPLFEIQRERIVDLAAKHRLPGIFEWRDFAEAGGKDATKIERYGYGTTDAGQDMSGLLRMIQAAYEVLSNPMSREGYDATLAREAAMADAELKSSLDQLATAGQRHVQNPPASLQSAVAARAA
jgi:ABC-type uncharacterized transport system substrate-binding protein